MSIDFALKDFYRKKKETFPYVITITLIVSLAIFLIYFSTSFNLNDFISQNNSYNNPYFFSGAINLSYSQFNLTILILVLIFAVIIISLVMISFINNKKRDISNSRGAGCLRR